jgi:hypothetical protein
MLFSIHKNSLNYKMEIIIMKTLVLFLTHNFNKFFLQSLDLFNNTIDCVKYECKVLLDDNENNCHDTAILNSFPNIEILPISRINSSYDTIGHSLYLNYFKKNLLDLDKYESIWVIENDVYFHGYLSEFIKIHECYAHDLLVAEYGLRRPEWEGFRNLKPLIAAEGVLGVIMRFKPRLMKELVLGIDSKYIGFMEAILPQICRSCGFTIGQFLPELCGVLTTDKKNPLIKLIERDLINSTTEYIEVKLYHPIKL